MSQRPASSFCLSMFVFVISLNTSSATHKKTERQRKRRLICHAQYSRSFFSIEHSHGRPGWYICLYGATEFKATQAELKHCWNTGHQIAKTGSAQLYELWAINFSGKCVTFLSMRWYFHGAPFKDTLTEVKDVLKKTSQTCKTGLHAEK